jgi:chaperonin GroES
MTAQELAAKIASRGGKLHGNRVAVAREKTETKTKGGLFIPESAQAENQYAAIIMIGDGPEVRELELEVGQRIYIQKFGGVDLKQKVGDKHFWLEVLHHLDIYITYPDDGAELQQTDASSTEPEYKK